MLVLEKLVLQRAIKSENKIVVCLRWITTMFFVSFGWAIFMADGYAMNDLFAFLGRLFHGVELQNRVTIASMGLFGYLPYVLLGISISFPSRMIFDRIGKRLHGLESKAYAVVHDMVLIGMLLLCIVYIIGGSYNPFIYYRF